MRKILLTAALVGRFAAPAFAHTILRDASTLTRGSLPNERLQYGGAGGPVQTGLGVIKSSMTEGILTSDFGVLKASHTEAGKAGNLVQNNPGVIASTMTSGLGVPLTLADETVPLTGGIITQINCVGAAINCTQSNGTGTITITAAAGTITTPFTLIVGTPGALGVNSVAASEESFDNILSSVGAMGLASFNSTVPAVIGFKDGVYEFATATVPANVIYDGLGSTVVFVFKGGVGQQMLRVYGQIRNIKLDISGVAFRSSVVQLSSGAVFGVPGREMEIYNIGSQVASVENSSALISTGATNVRIVTRIRDAIATGGVNYVGDTAPVMICNSSNVIAIFPTWQEGSDAATTGAHIGILRSTNVAIVDSNFYSWGAEGIGIQESHNVRIERNFFELTQTAGSHGVITAAVNAPGAKTSSFLIFRANTFWTKSTFASSMIKVGGQVVNGTIVEANTAFSSVGNTFITVGASALRTIISNNSHEGGSAFLSDGGTGTLSTGRNNTLNGVAQ